MDGKNLSIVVPNMPEAITRLSDVDTAKKIFTKIPDGISQEGVSVFVADLHDSLAAFFAAAFCLLSLVPLGAAAALFARNGLTWTWWLLAYSMLALVGLVFFMMWTRGFFFKFRYLSSVRVCFIFSRDKLIWAEKWLGHFQTETFEYDDLDEITHGGLNGGWDSNRALYLDRERLIYGYKKDGVCQWLYLMLMEYASGREILFKDIDQTRDE
jgi:hypothetical protein